MPILSAQDHAFFAENGYLVVPNAVPQENLDAVIAAIWDFLGLDPNDPEDWYHEPLTPGGMIEMYQHQALWDNRQYPRVHQIFSELLGTEKLWVSEDRVSMKPPAHPTHPQYDHKGFIHWDANTSKLPLPFRLQGVLCLTDTTAEMGGFQCVPAFHRILDEWAQTQPLDRNPHAPDLNALPEGMQVTPVPAPAGALIIWMTALLHGNGHNISNRPRLAQYINMYPVIDDETLRQARIQRWRERQPPAAPWVVGDPRSVEASRYQSAALTPLGRKLLGLDRWE